ETEVAKRIADGRIIFGRSGKSKPVQKVFLKDRLNKKLKAESWWENHGFNEDATTELKELFGTAKLFDHPKPSTTIAKLISIATDDESIILDFFAGSSTTAHAVMELNAQDKGRRKIILVQLTEPINADST